MNGYLPVDATGDWIFQACDIVSLLLVVWLLYYTFVEKKYSYDAQADSMSLIPIILGCFIAAFLLHADMNRRPLFDSLWMASLFLSVFSALPQLWLIYRTGGVIKACTGHFIAILALSRVLSGTFMWHARYDVTCEQWIDGFDHAIWAILGAHVLHLLLLTDFAFYYAKAVLQQGLNFQIELPAPMDIV